MAHPWRRSVTAPLTFSAKTRSAPASGKSRLLGVERLAVRAHTGIPHDHC